MMKMSLRRERENETKTSQATAYHLSLMVQPSEVVAPENDEPTPKPKTPEAWPAPLPPSTPPAKGSPLILKPKLPPVNTTMKPTSVADATPRTNEDFPSHSSKPPISPVKAVAEAVAAALAASTGPGFQYKELNSTQITQPMTPMQLPQEVWNT